MIESKRATADRSLAPDQLHGSIVAWRAAREAEWQEVMRHYQEAVSAFRRVVAIAGRRVDGKPPRPSGAAVPPRARAARRALADSSRLTGRQREIARLIAAGLTNRQIATELVLTEGTVANHVRHILLRLGVRCRAQVAAWVAAGGQDRGG